MAQGAADWADTYRNEMKLARSQCHKSYLDDVDALLRFSCDAARGIEDLDASTGVPALLLEELQGDSREVQTSNRDKACEAFRDAYMYIVERRRTKVESGQMAPRDLDQRKADFKEIRETSDGKKTRTSIKTVLKGCIQLHVNMVVDAWEARKIKCNQNCNVTGLQSLLAQAVELVYHIRSLNRDIGFSAEAMERFEKVLRCTIRGDIKHEVHELLGGQPDIIKGIMDIFDRKLQAFERRLQEILGVAIGNREAIMKDRPPRNFLLVPPLELPTSERGFNRLNSCSQMFHMYFVCRAFMDDLKEMGNEIPPESMNASPEFSDPLLVKQSAEFVENHKKAINFGLKVTNILLKVATNVVGLGNVIPTFRVKNYKRLTEFATNLRAQIGEHDREDKEYDYEGLRTFLAKHHNEEWREAVAAKLKVVVQGKSHAHVCKENASHEKEWKRRIDPTFSA